VAAKQKTGAFMRTMPLEGVDDALMNDAPQGCGIWL
jgi:hypothetical protein